MSIVNYTGQKIGHLKVLRRDGIMEKYGSKHVRWICKCSCGKEIEVSPIEFRWKKSCGCIGRGKPCVFHDLTGKVFEYLTVVRRIGSKRLRKEKGKWKNTPLWECKCVCGKTVELTTKKLKFSNQKSCGCFSKNGGIPHERMALMDKNLTDMSFDGVDVIRQQGFISSNKGKGKQDIYLCRCECGEETLLSRRQILQVTLACKCKNGIKNVEDRRCLMCSAVFLGRHVKYCSLSCADESTKKTYVNGEQVCPSDFKKFYKGNKGNKKINNDISAETRIIMEGGRGRPFEWNLSLRDIFEQWVKQEGRCPMTGWFMDLSTSKRGIKNPRQASLDRIDSQKGYMKGNVQFVAMCVNYAKNEFPEHVFKEMCQAVITHGAIQS